MGPVFGMKGGAAGGGWAQWSMTDINLHFTGDFAAIAAANNLLAALVDNHVHHGNALGIDVRSMDWKPVLDLNDRALRDVVVGLGGPANGYPREDGFDIVVASELMAIFCLTESWADLKRRIGDIVVGHTREKKPVTAREPKRTARWPSCCGTRSRPTWCRRWSTPRFWCTVDRSQTSRTAAAQSSRPGRPCGWSTMWSRRPASGPISARRSLSTSSAASPVSVLTRRCWWRRFGRSSSTVG